uniref:Uncharacterized protein n=1 Tax=Anopheles atroparvus TaxID=41427 RepID=A0A182IPY2_ANOAO
RRIIVTVGVVVVIVVVVSTVGRAECGERWVLPPARPNVYKKGIHGVESTICWKDVVEITLVEPGSGAASQLFR